MTASGTWFTNNGPHVYTSPLLWSERTMHDNDNTLRKRKIYENYNYELNFDIGLCQTFLT